MGPVGGAANASQGMRWRVGTRGIGPARGQSLVEFALVLPLFLMLIFAVVEFSLINTAIGAYNYAAKDAARLGAILGPAPTTPGADQQMLALILSHVSAIPAATPYEVIIFQATESGTYSTSALQDQYFYNANGTWTAGTLTWQPGNSSCGGPTGCRNDSLVSQDYLGVLIIYHYTYVTALLSSLGATITLQALSVQRIEPQQIYHRPAPETGASIAALNPPGPRQPLLVLAALMPLWAFTTRRVYRMGRMNGKEGQG